MNPTLHAILFYAAAFLLAEVLFSVPVALLSERQYFWVNLFQANTFVLAVAVIVVAVSGAAVAIVWLISHA